MTIYFISLNKNILVKTCLLNLNLSIKFLFHPSILPPSSTVNNFDGIFVDRPSWARAIVGTRYVSIESGKWSTRANRFLTVLIIRVRFSFLRERGSIYRYAEDIFIPLASSVRRALDEKRNGEGGGEGKGGREKMKWSLYEIRFPKRHPLSTTPVHVGYQIFLLAFLRNRLLRLLSSYTRATLTHPGCAVKPILETIYITKTYFFHRIPRSHLT